MFTADLIARRQIGDDVGARIRPDQLRPRNQPDGSIAPRSISKQAGEVTVDADTMQTVAPIEIAQPREAPLSASGREAVFVMEGEAMADRNVGRAHLRRNGHVT